MVPPAETLPGAVPESAEEPERKPWRRWLTRVLVILTVVSVVATTLAIWAHATVFDTDQFMQTVQPSLEDPALYEAVAERVSDEIIVALDIEQRVNDALTGIDEYLSGTLLEAIDLSPQGQALLDRFDRPSLAVLAAPIAEAFNARITERVDAFITSDAFTSRVPNLVRDAHAAIIALIRSDVTSLPNAYVEDGNVRLNLIPIIADALRRVAAEIRDFLPDVNVPDVVSNAAAEGRDQLATALKADLPDDFGQVTLFKADTLSTVQSAAQRFDRLVWGLVVLSIILAVSTIAMSQTRRRTTIQLSLGVAAGLIIGVAAARRLQAMVLEEITSPNGLAAARSMLTDVVGSLRSLALIIVLVGAAIALAAYLSGRPAWFTRLTDRATGKAVEDSDDTGMDQWIADHHDLLTVAGVAAAVFILFVWGISVASVLVVGAALALYLWAIAMERRGKPEGTETPTS